MVARLSAFVIWALVAATAVFWGLRLLVRAPAAPTYAMAVGDATAVRGDLTRLLGAAPVSAPAAATMPDAGARFRLIGIMAPKDSSAPASHGVALIAVDGKMPRAYTVGSRLDGDLVLQSVSLRTASIGAPRGVPAITLELPPLAAAATGTLPQGGGFTPPATMPAPVPRYVPVPPPAAPESLAPPPVPPLVPRPSGQMPPRPDTNPTNPNSTNQ